MKNIFQALAKYNSNVNMEIAGILEGMTAEKLEEKTKAFYPTVKDCLFHVFASDFAMCRRYKLALPGSGVLSSALLLDADIEKIKSESSADIKAFFKYRRELDGLLAGFVGELTDEQLMMPFHYTNYKKEKVETVMWKMLLHNFNHQTHHRGGLAAMLDILGVKNDFSGTLNKIN